MNLPKRNTATGAAPLIQWNNGKTEAKTEGQTRFISFVGWTSEQGKDPAFDAACRAAKIPTVEIRHRQGDDGAGQTIKEHWHIGDTLAVFPLTTGPVSARIGTSLRPENKDATVDAAIGVSWEEGDRSKAAVRALFPPVLAEGYTGLVQVGGYSTMSDYLLSALVDHCTRVCADADRLLGRDVFPGELLLPLAPGPEVVVGKGDKSSNVTVFVSAHPKVIDRAYIDTIYRADDVIPLIEAKWDSCVAWARAFSGPRLPRDPQVTEIGAPEPMRQIEGPRPQLGLERDYASIRQAIDETANPRQLEALRMEALDARDKRRITMQQYMAIAEEVDIKSTAAPAVPVGAAAVDAATFDDIPF